MALADRVQDEPRNPTGLPCSVGAVAQQLAGKELKAFNAMLFELGWSWRKIHDALMAEGYVVSGQQVNRHRSRACRCFKESS